VPAPATAHILRDAPIYGGKIKGELCTPTGAALLKHFADEFGAMPEMKVSNIGYGMGKKDFEAANCVLAFLGEATGVGNAHEADAIREAGVAYGADVIRETIGAGNVRDDEGGPNGRVAEICCNIDDMTSEEIGYVSRALLDMGALDVFTTAVGMKKDRPGILLTCVCDEEQADAFAALMLKHSTTFGVRKAILSRYILERDVRAIQTPFGPARLKTGKGYGVAKSKLEYEDVAALAKEHDIPIHDMERRIWAHITDGEGEGS
jgi:uncharacterized protein (DUF111 family)